MCASTWAQPWFTISSSLTHLEAIVCGNVLHFPLEFHQLLLIVSSCSLHIRPSYTWSTTPLMLLPQTSVCSPTLAHPCIPADIRARSYSRCRFLFSLFFSQDWDAAPSTYPPAPINSPASQKSLLILDPQYFINIQIVGPNPNCKRLNIKILKLTTQTSLHYCESNCGSCSRPYRTCG